MREKMMVFGKGARACLGRRLAIIEIKCATAAMVRRYEAKIGSITADDDIENHGPYGAYSEATKMHIATQPDTMTNFATLSRL
jgi:hypothetical protein